VTTVIRNDVPFARGAAADDVVLSSIGDAYAGGSVAQTECAAGVCADVVAGDYVACSAAGDIDAVTAVTGDDVPFAGGAAADGVIIGTAGDDDSIVCVAQFYYAVDVGADVVAGDDVTLRSAAVNADTTPAITRDDVSPAGGAAANGVIIGAAGDQNPIVCVAQFDRAVGVGTNVVAGDCVVLRVVSGNANTIPAITRDDVSLVGCTAADNVIQSAAEDDDPIVGVAQNGRTAGVGADVVAGDGVARWCYSGRR